MWERKAGVRLEFGLFKGLAGGLRFAGLFFFVESVESTCKLRPLANDAYGALVDRRPLAETRPLRSYQTIVPFTIFTTQSIDTYRIALVTVAKAGQIGSRYSKGLAAPAASGKVNGPFPLEK